MKIVARRLELRRVEGVTMSDGAAMSPETSASAPPAPNPWVDDIAPYVGGESGSESGRTPLKLSSNENPFGPSPRAVDAYRRASDNLHIYPDGAAARLRGAIAAVHGLDPDRIVCGAGSDELISLLCQAYCAPGDEVVHSAHGFAMYRISAKAAGAEPVSARENGLTASVDAILEAVSPRTRLVFLANPNNPTGTYLSRGELERLADALPAHALLVVDGAYAEYLRAPDYECGLKLSEARRRVIALRTFSKIHGLAALRIGWAHADPAVIEALNKVRGPFNLSAPALAAGEAAVRDRDYVESCLIQNEVWRDWLIKQLRGLGVETPDSFGNFVLPEFGVTGPTSAPAVDAFLRSRDIYVRRMESYGLPAHLRITVGSASDNVAVARAIGDFFAAARGEAPGP